MLFSYKLQGDPVQGGGFYLAEPAGPDTIAMTLSLELDAIKHDRIELYESLFSRDLLRLTGAHLIASRSKPLRYWPG